MGPSPRVLITRVIADLSSIAMETHLCLYKTLAFKITPDKTGSGCSFPSSLPSFHVLRQNLFSSTLLRKVQYFSLLSFLGPFMGSLPKAKKRREGIDVRRLRL
jgi:hypothetical protein